MYGVYLNCVCLYGVYLHAMNKLKGCEAGNMEVYRLDCQRENRSAIVLCDS